MMYLCLQDLSRDLHISELLLDSHLSQRQRYARTHQSWSMSATAGARRDEPLCLWRQHAPDVVPRPLQLADELGPFVRGNAPRDGEQDTARFHAGRSSVQAPPGSTCPEGYPFAPPGASSVPTGWGGAPASVETERNSSVAPRRRIRRRAPPINSRAFSEAPASA